jgi:pyrroline-5-carboxylate reductase
MGGALIEGWAAAGGLDAAALLICDPNPSERVHQAAAQGARLNPPAETLAEAKTVLLAVKPQTWRAAASQYAGQLGAQAHIVSIIAGVRAADLEDAFQRPVARVMPTTAVAIRKGVATVFAAAPESRLRAHALFEPVCAVVDVDDEGLVDAATAVSGSAPAYFYAFIEALEAAGTAVGLSETAARILVRNTLIGAAALMEQTGEEPAELRRQVTSKAGTTEAALKVLGAEGGLQPLMLAAVRAALMRARELAA